MDRASRAAGLLAQVRRPRSEQRLRRRLYFRSPSLDLYLQMALSYGSFGGSSVGEALYAASQIRERDLGSWVRAWQAAGERADTDARAALEQGHPATARQASLRAFTYLRTATHALGPSDPRLEPMWRRAAEAFGRAAGLTDPPMEPLRVPVGDGVLPGWLMRPPGPERARPTLLLFGGGETYAEDMLFWGGATGMARGWNVVAVEVPGQGSTAFDGLRFRADVEAAVSRIIDHVLTRTDVDPARLAGYGLSLGGYIVLRAAEHDRRIRAVAASTPIADWHGLLTASAPALLRRFPRLMDMATTSLTPFFDPVQLVVFQRFFQWQVGARTLGDALRLFHPWTVDVTRVTCPVLSMVGEGEGEAFQRQAAQVHELLPGPKALRTFPAPTGADAHSQTNNLPLAQETVFDWLEQVLPARPAGVAAAAARR